MDLIYRLRVNVATILYDLAMWIAPPVPAPPFKFPEVVTFPDPWDGAPIEPFRFPATSKVAKENREPTPD